MAQTILYYPTINIQDSAWLLYHRSLRGVDTGFEGVLWGDIPVRKYNKIKGRSRKRPQPAHKAPQCGAFRGFETAV